MISTGRVMLYMLGSARMQLIAVGISGASELIQRSSIVVTDELMREHLFKAEINEAVRARQIQMWTQVSELCASQTVICMDEGGGAGGL